MADIITLTRTLTRIKHPILDGAEEQVTLAITIDPDGAADYIMKRMYSHYWKDSATNCEGAITAKVIKKEMPQ